MLSLWIIEAIFMNIKFLEVVLNIASLFAGPLFDRFKPIRRPLDEAYKKALKRWCKNNVIRERIARDKFFHFSSLKDYIVDPNRISDQEIASLLKLWEEEIRKDVQTYQILQSACYSKENWDCNEEENQKLTDIRIELSEGFQRLSTQIENFVKDNIDKKSIAKEYPEIKNYIPRNVREYDSINPINAFFNPSKYVSKPILDYIIEGKEKKFLLYSDAQCGKSTEIAQLAHVLQQSEIYNPVLFKLSRYVSTRSLQEQVNYNNVFSATGVGVILLDGLDEIKDVERNNVIHEIEAISEEFACVYFVISCRSNFETTNNISGFKKLYLDELCYDDVKAYIEKNSDNSQELLNEIVNKQLYDVIYNPFYLHSIIQYFNEKGTLPDNKTIIYDFIIDSCFNADDRRGYNVSKLYTLKSEGFSLLQKMAFCLQCTNKQYFTDQEWFEELKYTKEDLELCSKFSIFKREKDNSYTFIHNAFKEFIIAKQLKGLSFKELKNLVCYCNTDKLALSWYNVIVLLVGLLDKTDKLYDSVMDWLVNNENELLIKCDCHFLGSKTKFDIFINIFNYYNKFQICIPYNLEMPLMKFVGNGKVIPFLLDELRSAKVFNVNTINVLNLLKYANFSILSEEDQEDCREVLFTCLVRFKDQEDSGNYLLKPFSNQCFCDVKIIEAIYAIIKDSKDSGILRSFFRLLVKNDLCDEYADWVLTKGRYIHDYRKKDYIVQVPKGELYDVFKGFTKAKYIGKVLAFFRGKQSYSEEREVKKQLFCNAEKIFKEEIEIVDEIVNVLIKEPINLYGSNDQLVEGLMLYRNFFFNIKKDSCIYDKYLAKLIECHSSGKKAGVDVDSLQDELYGCINVISTLMTNERFEALLSCNELDENDLFVFVSMILDLTFGEFVVTWKSMFEIRFSKFMVPVTDWKKRYQEEFDILFNFKEFKSALERLACESKLFLVDYSNPSLKGINGSVEKFIWRYEKDENKCVDLEMIINLLNEKDFIRYAYGKIYDYICHGQYELNITASQKNLIENMVIEDVQNMSNEDDAKRIISLIKKLDLDIDIKYLLQLLPYSYIEMTTRSENEGRCIMVSSSFLIYLKNKIEKRILDKEIENILKCGSNYSSDLYECLCDYIVDCKVANYYKYLIKLLFLDVDQIPKKRFQCNLIHRVLKLGHDAIDLLLPIHEKLELQSQIFLFKMICQKEELFNFVVAEDIIPKLEKLYCPEKNDEQILSLLMFFGSKKALLDCIEYVKKNKYAFYTQPFSLKNYDLDQVDNILTLLEVGLTQKISLNEPYSIAEVALTALARLALTNMQSRNYIIERVKQIADSDIKYVSLNYRMELWSNRYFEVNNEASSIPQAIQKYEVLYS